ncbi:hypothetical protein [Kingella oralis]|jgi:hypothetical protein|uniref:hypothetical protein n=1 Tax=Kingella oralis TaxID=505 RepID=UPI002D7FAF8A|nr:hypothetical protein [Kingella oralis]
MHQTHGDSYLTALAQKYAHAFPLNDISNIQHYLRVGEHEMAWESFALSCLAHTVALTVDEIRAIYFQLNALGLQQNSVYVGDVVALFAARYMP